MTAKKIALIPAFVFCLHFQAFGQHLCLTFQEAERQGISIIRLDSVYKSAVHTDTSQAVFQTGPEQQKLQQAYIKLLQDFGKFLSENNFQWEKQTRCFNRIYFAADGTIDYFVFNFLGNTEDKPPAHKQLEFQRLLNAFIKNYRFPLAAKIKFAQCSPATYAPKK